MLKKYKAFMNNEGKFEPPGAKALQDFKNLYDIQMERARIAKAIRAEEVRDRAGRESADSGGSVETVTRERFFPETVASTPPPVKPEPELGSPICAICLRDCQVCPNPWQRTRSGVAVAKLTNISRPPPTPYGIALGPCRHVFCGACLAQSIYHSLNMAFDPATYGSKLPSYVPDSPGLGREFPIPCPICQVKKGVKPTHISDATARLVLGEPNMNEWNYARFLHTLNVIHCPHQGCNAVFDVDDVVPAQGIQYARTRVQCPRCKGSLCKACKSVWHENLTCLMYQASPVHERFPDREQLWDAPKPVSVHHRRAAIYSPSDSANPWTWDEPKLVAT